MAPWIEPGFFNFPESGKTKVSGDSRCIRGRPGISAGPGLPESMVTRQGNHSSHHPGTPGTPGTTANVVSQ